ncbi:unnamed protein product [Caretta caretta]
MNKREKNSYRMCCRGEGGIQPWYLLLFSYELFTFPRSSSKMDFEDRCCTGKQSQGFFQLQDIDRFTCVKQWGQLVVNCLNHRETPPMKKWKHSLFCISKFLVSSGVKCTETDSLIHNVKLSELQISTLCDAGRLLNT